MSINGQELPHNDAGFGTGTFGLDGGRFITTKWHFRCVDDVEGVIDMIIQSFDGDAIPEVSFSTRYSTPDHLLEVSQPRVHDVAETPGSKDDDSATMASCDSLKCLIHKMATAAKEAAQNVHKKLSSQSQKTVVKAASTSGEQPIVDHSSSHKADSPQKSNQLHLTWDHQELFSDSLFGPLLVAIVAFSFFSFFSILFANRHRIRTALAERRARRSQRRNRRLRTLAERRAARAERRQAMKDFFSRLFRSLLDPDAEKRAAEEERRQHLVEANARDERNTTMEEELAGFRAAAAMVGDLVAAEEGRQQRREAPLQVQQPPPVPPRPQMSAFVTFDEPLPAYEEPLHDSATVADGFRYAPGSRESTSLPRSMHESSSDRLGYNK